MKIKNSMFPPRGKRSNFTNLALSFVHFPFVALYESYVRALVEEFHSFCAHENKQNDENLN